MGRTIIILLIIGLLATACSKDRPRALAELEIIPVSYSEKDSNVLEVMSQQERKAIKINHHIKNKDIYVECYIPNFVFKEKGGSKKNGEGHLGIFVDGKLIDEIYTAAFILKNFPKGEHSIKVEVFHNDSSSYNLSTTWIESIK